MTRNKQRTPAVIEERVFELANCGKNYTRPQIRKFIEREFDYEISVTTIVNICRRLAVEKAMERAARLTNAPPASV